MIYYLSSQIHDISKAHVLVELHHETFFQSGSTIYKKKLLINTWPDTHFKSSTNFKQFDIILSLNHT